jgi:hypothetical protein
MRLSLLVLLLAGCSTQKAMHLDLLCVGPGGEVFHANGISAKQAAEMQNDWDFDSCKVKVKEQQGAAKPPIKH